MIPAQETFNGTWPFAAHFHTIPADQALAPFQMHYVDEGPGETEPVIFVHGEPTWGYLYRNMIPSISAMHRVIVPDHMGFGKSETPQDRQYTLRSHVENLASLIEALDLTNITFVLQDWGGPIGTQYTLRHPARVKRLFLANTMVGYGAAGRTDLPRLRDSRWFRWIGEGLETGRTEAVLCNLDSTVLSVMKIIGFENMAVVNDDWIRAYSAPFPTPLDCIGAIDFPMDVYHRRIRSYLLEGVVGLDGLTSKPAMLVEGLRDQAMPPDLAIADFKALWPNSTIVELPGAGHFCQEDAPQTLVALLQQFIQLHP